MRILIIIMLIYVFCRGVSNIHWVCGLVPSLSIEVFLILLSLFLLELDVILAHLLDELIKVISKFHFFLRDVDEREVL